MKAVDVEPGRKHPSPLAFDKKKNRAYFALFFIVRT